ncbi:MAG: hypothetical protein ACYDEP_02460 [Acidimicrobiales bacterium]
MKYPVRHTGRQRRRLLLVALKLLAIPALAGIFLLVTTTSASAASTGANAGQSLFCQVSGSTSNNPRSQNYLPMIRWSNAVTSQHTDLSVGITTLNQLPGVIERDGIVSGLNGISQSEWTLSTNLVELSQRFCIADSTGFQVDNIVGKLWKAISGGINGPVLLTALALIVIVSALWNASRGKPKPWNKALKFLVILGLLSAMGAGAAASTIDAKGNYVPGTLSPGWVITNTFNIISTVGNSVSSAVAQVNQSPLSLPSKVKNVDPLTCAQYTQQLVTDYQNTYSPNATLAASVPESLNGLWMQSTIPTFVDEQFGMDNNFGPLVYCRLLEDESGIPPATQMRISQTANPVLTNTSPKTISQALAWNTTSNQTIDESVIGWAACQSPGASLVPSEWDLSNGTQIYPPEWTKVVNPDNNQGMTIQKVDCQLWWGAKGFGGACGYGCNIPVSAMNNSAINPAKSAFYWPNDPSGIQQAADNAGQNNQLTGGQGPVGAGVNNFLSNFHGTTSTSAVITAYIYLLSSTGVAVVFIILALAILLAKLALLVSMLLMIFVVLAALMPGGSPDKIAAFGKHLLGLILFVTCGSLLVSLIAVLTSLIVAAGTGLVGNYNIMSILWVGLSPLGAIILVHHFFKKVLKAPSPFKPSSALAYSAAAGGFAGGIGGASLTNRLYSRGMQGVKGAASRGVSKDNLSTNPRSSRTGGMDPAQANRSSKAKSSTNAAQETQIGERPIGQQSPGQESVQSVPTTRREAKKIATKIGGNAANPPHLRMGHGQLGNAISTHYKHWKDSGGVKRGRRTIALGAAALALGAPGGLAVGAFAYHRYRARKRAGTPSRLAEFRQVGRDRRQQALAEWHKGISEKQADATQVAPDPPTSSHPPSQQHAPTNQGRRVDPPSHPRSSTPPSASGRPGVRRVDNTPRNEPVEGRHMPNRPPEPTPPELYDEPGGE